MKATIVPPSSMQTSKLFQLHRENPETAIFFLSPSRPLALFPLLPSFFCSSFFSSFFASLFANSRLPPTPRRQFPLSAHAIGYLKFLFPSMFNRVQKYHAASAQRANFLTMLKSSICILHMIILRLYYLMNTVIMLAI